MLTRLKNILILGFNNPLYLTQRLFILIILNVAIFAIGFQMPFLFVYGQIYFYVLVLLVLIDFSLLFISKGQLFAQRSMNERLSNGDVNQIEVLVNSSFRFNLMVKFIDEIPLQFQVRDFNYKFVLAPFQEKLIKYELRPTQRGVYNYGSLLFYLNSVLGLLERRIVIEASKSIAVYPSYLQLQKYEFMAISDRLFELGVKKIRRIGHNKEFDNIRDYVIGDDMRVVNWKATARKGHLMVNTYDDEKSQNIYCVIDKGRSMKMPFDGMTLLDYAINASLVLSNIAIKKQDNAGLITFSNLIGTIMKADKKSFQMKKIQEALYDQDMRFNESDYARLYKNIKLNLKHRSLLVLFTNFESDVALKRQLPYLRKIAKDHVLIIVFFENSEVKKLSLRSSNTLDGIHDQIIAYSFMNEKKLMIKELNQLGIYTIYTTPENLTVNSLNKYLELKARGVI